MINISAKIRENKGRKVKKLRTKGILPAVLYGPKIKNQLLEINLKDFKKVYQQVGESSLIDLQITGSQKAGQESKKLVLIHDIKKEPLLGEIIHVDFYQPILTEEVEVSVPVVFEGTSPAVKDLGGTLVREIQELKIKALPKDLPGAIIVDIEVLKTFDDEILIKHLELPPRVKVLKNPEEIVAVVVPPEKVEEELAKPIEEKIEEVEKVEKEKKEKEPEEETAAVQEKTGEKKEEKKTAK